MPTRQETVEPPPRRIRSSDVWHGCAFGIEVASRFPIPELPASGRDRDSPDTTIELAERPELERIWLADGTTTLVRRTFPDGSPMMVVEHHDDVGYRIWAPRYGRHVVSRDGALVRSALPRVAAWRWERLLFAQVLPLAAALHGRQLFHASAVALAGGAVGLTGSPGAGKSSVAAHLVARGAALVTDDVLALELSGHRIHARAGASLVGVDGRELTAMTAAGRARLGARLGRSDKTYVATPLARDPVPLRALYFLARADRRSIEIGAPEGSVAARLLGSGFITYLQSRELLVQQLDVCARIAEAVPTFEVSVPASAPATAVAAAVDAHVRALASESG